MKDRIFTSFNDCLGTDDFFDYSEIQEKPLVFPTYIMKTNEKKEYNEKMTNQDYLVAFSTQTQNYCVGLIDMVNSTKISASIGQARVSRYYQIFLNSMSRVLSRYGGFVIKNVGDCLVYYFPESAKARRKFGFLSCLESSLAMVEAHDTICKYLQSEGLPPVDYRISNDYGSVVVMKSNSSSLDMIGPPVNMCSKINHRASKNGIVIGGDLYETAKDFKEYHFKETTGFSLGFKHQYPVYTLSRKK